MKAEKNTAMADSSDPSKEEVIENAKKTCLEKGLGLRVNGEWVIRAEGQPVDLSFPS